MATLEKIRSKSVILFVVIIVALLAFILGDFLTSSRSLTGPGTTAAKVAGQKIDFQQFQQRVEQQRMARQEQAQRQAQATGQKAQDVDIAAIQNEVLQQMIFEALMEKEAKSLGLSVTDNELSNAMVGSSQLPQVIQYAQGRYGISPIDFYDMSHNPGKYQISPEQAAQFSAMWGQFENEINQLLIDQKFGALLSALTANKLDARALYEDNASTSRIAFVKKDFNTVDDSEIKVNDDDIHKVYNERKNRFRLTEQTRPIEYIEIPIVPSDNDLLAAQQEVESAIANLKQTPGTDAVNDNFNFDVKRSSLPMSSLSAPIKNRIDSLMNDSVQMISKIGNVYTLAKLINKYNEVDTLTYDYALIPGSKEVQDSVVLLLNNGVSIDTLTAQGLVVRAEYDQKLFVPTSGQMAQNFVSAPLNVYTIPSDMSSDEGGSAVKVTKKNAPVPVYDIATITYEVKPSAQTIADLRRSLKAYADTNNTYVKFHDNALAAGYSVFPGAVTPSSLKIANVKDSRSAAKWAMNAKKGQVSDVYGNEQSGSYLVVAVREIYDDYIPETDNDLKHELTAKARSNKKGEKLMSDFYGKASDLSGYAALLEVEPDTTTVNFGQNYIRSFPMGTAALAANVSVATPGELVGPFVTDNALVVFEIVDVDKSGRDFDPENDALNFNQQLRQTILGRNFFEVLLGNEKITNNLQKFYSE